MGYGSLLRPKSVTVTCMLNLAATATDERAKNDDDDVCASLGATNNALSDTAMTANEFQFHMRTTPS